MSTATSTAERPAPPVELPPGYYVCPETGAWLTLPWPGDHILPWGHPDRVSLLPPSLAPALIRWAEEWLLDPLTGEPWRFTSAQRRFLHLWYALDERGRWAYRSGVKRGAKGTGKDPFGAAIALCEFAGPVEFAGWDGDRPLSRPRRMALVQIAANSEDQAKDVLRVANAMLSKHLKSALEIDSGSTRTVRPGGSRIELLTSSETSSEGDPATAIILNESHHMTRSSGGHAVAAVARRNVAKSPKSIAARLLELTNAHQQGMDSVAERSYEAWQAQVGGKTRKRDILYDSREADPRVNIADEVELMRGLQQAYHDAPWSDLERLRDEVYDIRTSIADTIRYYLNGLAAAEDAWVDPKKFDALARPDEVVAEGERIAMFLDCSKSDDATGLVACRLSDGHVMTLRTWQRPHGDRGTGWLAPRHEVDAEVRAAFKRWRVAWFGVDPSPARDDEDEAQYWMPLVDEWHRDFRDEVEVWASPGTPERGTGNAVAFDMRLSAKGGRDRNKLITEAAMQTVADIEDDAPRLTHDGAPVLRNHVHNAKRRPNAWGFTLGKVSRDSSKKVDLAMCMVGARLGRRLALAAAKEKKRRTGRVY